MKQLLIIKLFVWFGWLSSIALAQLEISGAITGSASFPHVGITCLGNLAVFITSFLRRRLDLEVGARDYLATITGHCKLVRKKGENLSELVNKVDSDKFSVVMLSSSEGMTNCSTSQFVQYIYNAHRVNFIVLRFDNFGNQDRSCKSGKKQHKCNCILIRADKEKVPKFQKLGLKLCSCGLLPSLKCQENGCHGCNPKELAREQSQANLNLAVCDALDFEFTKPTQKEPICICIPVSDDKWTKLLVRSFKNKEEQERAVIVAASDALESYLDIKKKDADSDAQHSYLDTKEGRTKEGRAEEVEYRTVSLIVIRFVEILINLLLTGLFKVDGLSSSLAARRAVRSYVVDSKGNGLPANVFLTSALVVVNPYSVCQVLKFRGNILGSRTLLFIVGFFNLICALAWAAVFIVFNGGVGKWYEIPSMPPSKPRVAVIIVFIGIGIAMDCFDFFKLVRKDKKSCKNIWDAIKKTGFMGLAVITVIVIEMVFAVVVGAPGFKKGIGRWVYGALELLVWVKWVVGSYMLGTYFPEYVPISAGRAYEKDGFVKLRDSSSKWEYNGTLVYSSSFLLNAVLVGVMGDWAGVWSTWK